MKGRLLATGAGGLLGYYESNQRDVVSNDPSRPILKVGRSVSRKRRMVMHQRVYVKGKLRQGNQAGSPDSIKKGVVVVVVVRCSTSSRDDDDQNKPKKKRK